MAERVDAPPEIDQSPALPPSTHPLGIDPGSEQLPPRNHPMLLLGQRPDETNGVFVFHDDT